MYENRNIDLRVLEMHSGRRLARVLAKKLTRRLGSAFRRDRPYERAAIYNGITVFDSSDLNGEGPTVGQDYTRALLQLGFKRCDRIFEFCAGPGYIGYSLLAHGFCEKLTLADINPAAVAMAQETARFNGIEPLVNIYESDKLKGIPESERWDLVVGNPPHFLRSSEADQNIKVFDPDWVIHRGFYEQVGAFMQPGGHVVMMENAKGSTVEVFLPMIEKAGAEFITELSGHDVTGKDNGMYYVVSRW